jgi:hypothetical protein
MMIDRGIRRRILKDTIKAIAFYEEDILKWQNRLARLDNKESDFAKILERFISYSQARLKLFKNQLKQIEENDK